MYDSMYTVNATDRDNKLCNAVDRLCRSGYSNARPRADCSVVFSIINQLQAEWLSTLRHSSHQAIHIATSVSLTNDFSLLTARIVRDGSH